MNDLVLHLVALLAFPGALLTVATGVVAETLAAVVLDGARPRSAFAAVLALARQAVTRGDAVALVAVLLALLAATQLAFPFNPMSPLERNLLVAVVALSAAMWLGWSWSAPGGGGTAAVQLCWLVALLAPALVSQTLRPQALAAVEVPAQLPLKALSALVALACLPALLRLLPGAQAGSAAARVPLWLPMCGLVASVFAPPAGDDLPGLLGFAGAVIATAAVAVGLAAVAARTPAAAVLWPRLVAPLTAVVVVVAAVTAVVT